MEFLLYEIVAMAWKNFVQSSPSLILFTV
jgi:hypothetical protein